jgi:hypothetical protein
VTEQVVVMAMG